MPVIFLERDYSRWLDVDALQLPMHLLRPYEAGRMTAWEVDKRFGIFARILPNSSTNN
jgi:putative SOS response-associated peptidase YedK